MTFLEIVQSKGYESIADYLEDVEGCLPVEPDFTEHELQAIRRAEAGTSALLGVAS